MAAQPQLRSGRADRRPGQAVAAAPETLRRMLTMGFRPAESASCGLAGGLQRMPPRRPLSRARRLATCPSCPSWGDPENAEFLWQT